MKQIILLIVILSIALSLGCQDVPLLAEKDATLTLTADKTFLRAGGDTATITIMGYTGTWEALRDGTQVALTASLGSIPASVELHNGQAVASFVSGAARGQATITARSGNATAEVTIDIEYSATARIALKATPPSLAAGGGRVRIQVEVTDNRGNPYVKVPVTLRTTSGYFEKGQNSLYTDGRGIVVNPLHTEATAEIIASSLGQSATLTVTVADNAPPTAAFTFWPDTPRIGEDVTFDGSASSDTDGEIRKYVWSFNDGYKTDGRTITRSFSRAGTYEASLQVVDDMGAASPVTTKTVTVADNQAPEATFSFSPTTPSVGTTVRFDGSMSTDPDGWIERWEWDFGDGSSDTGEEATHSYDYVGTFTVRLIVTDGDGTKDDASQSLTVVSNQPPTANFTYYKTGDGGGTTYEFDGSGSYDADGYIVSYRWDFGDGSAAVIASDTRVTHTFPEKATYTVRLIVEDNMGSTAEAVRDVAVE